MSTRVESENSNPLAEFFEFENQEDEMRRRQRASRPFIRARNRFNYGNRPARFRPPRFFPRRFIRSFPRPRRRPPFPFPYPYPFPIEPLQQPAPPPDFAASGAAAPGSDWDPQGAVVEPMGQSAPDGDDVTNPQGERESEWETETGANVITRGVKTMTCGCGGQKQVAATAQPEFSVFQSELEYLPGEMEQGGQPAVSPPRATYRLECPAGCTPFIAAQCETTLRQAILDAISIANTAARKLTAAPVDNETRRLFRFFLGHEPSRPVPWANNEESRLTVAKRLITCAHELGGGRRTLYRCSCPGAGAGVRAITISPIEVRLCPRFWGASPQAGLSDRAFRAGVILHEMLHQLYLEFVRHDANERRRNNAHCYEALAMRLAGHAADQSDVTQCRERPA